MRAPHFVNVTVAISKHPHLLRRRLPILLYLQIEREKKKNRRRRHTMHTDWEMLKPNQCTHLVGHSLVASHLIQPSFLSYYRNICIYTTHADTRLHSVHLLCKLGSFLPLVSYPCTRTHTHLRYPFVGNIADISLAPLYS